MGEVRVGVFENIVLSLRPHARCIHVCSYTYMENILWILQKKKSNYNLKIFIYEEYIVYKLVYNEIHITKVGHAAINICEENK